VDGRRLSSERILALFAQTAWREKSKQRGSRREAYGVRERNARYTLVVASGVDVCENVGLCLLSGVQARIARALFAVACWNGVNTTFPHSLVQESTPVIRQITACFKKKGARFRVDKNGEESSSNMRRMPYVENKE
jgi:hypothetical protein